MSIDCGLLLRFTPLNTVLITFDNTRWNLHTFTSNGNLIFLFKVFSQYGASHKNEIILFFTLPSYFSISNTLLQEVRASKLK